MKTVLLKISVSIHIKKYDYDGMRDVSVRQSIYLFLGLFPRFSPRSICSTSSWIFTESYFGSVE